LQAQGADLESSHCEGSSLQAQGADLESGHCEGSSLQAQRADLESGHCELRRIVIASKARQSQAGKALSR